MQNNIEIKKELLKMWFERVYERINLLESKINHLNTKQPEKNDYDYLIDELDTHFNNLMIIKKVLNNDVQLYGYNYKKLKK